MNTSSFDYLVKILMIGDSGVGKTCILQKFENDECSINHLPTIAIDFSIKTIVVNGKSIKMQIWDTAGQERFNTLTAGFFRGSDGIVLCYALDDPRSFRCVDKWMEQIGRLAPPDAQVLLVATKADLDRGRRVSAEEAAEMAAKHGLELLETSAKEGRGVAEVFNAMAEMILAKLQGSACEGAPAAGLGVRLPLTRRACCRGG